MPLLKICSKCEQAKTYEDFYTRYDSNRKMEVVTACCKECRSKHYYMSNTPQHPKEVVCVRCGELFWKPKGTREVCELCLIDMQQKECRSCHRLLPYTNFYDKVTRCMECIKEAHRLRKADEHRTKRNRRRIKDDEKNIPLHLLAMHRKLMRKYGLHVNDYLAMVKATEGACYICKQVPETQIHVDHDHKTGKVRGLLCANCNHGLGKFKDDHSLLAKAIEYLTPSTQDDRSRDSV